MFVTYIQTYKHTYIQTLWLLESLDLLDRETKKLKNAVYKKIGEYLRNVENILHFLQSNESVDKLN